MEREPRRTAGTKSGFTVIELIIVIGLMTLLAGLVVVNVTPIFEGLGAPPIERTLKQAVREARYHAALEKEATFLRFDSEASAFIITNVGNSELGKLPTGFEGQAAAELEIEFYQLLPEQGLSSFRRSGERSEIQRVRFQPDRSSTPFEAEIHFGRDVSVHRYDPFSAVELKGDE